MNNINIEVKKLRKQKNMTQEQLAEVLGLKRSTYAHLETYGNFKDSQIIKLSEFFNRDNIMVIDDGLVNKNMLKMEVTVFEKNLIELFRKLSKERREEICLEILNG